MNLAAEILVVILSIFLAIFLIVGTILTVYLISLTRQIRRITTSAEHTVDNLGSAISTATKMISPMVIAEAIAKLFKKFKKNKGDK